ncbi:MAG: redoxin domain-containing protein [Armatimonadetes bacterium]|nr:redoxin domain-containing protein [Armatimonadota bacterium]
MPMRTGTPLPALDGVEKWYHGPPDAESLNGHPVLVHFWAVSCGQCKDTLPNVNEWKEQYKDQGLKVVGVHMPRSEADLEIGPVEEVIRDYDLEHPQAIDEDYAIVDRFENKYVPAFYIFDREGNLRHFQAGDRGMKMIQAALDRVIGASGNTG